MRPTFHPPRLALRVDLAADIEPAAVGASELRLLVKLQVLAGAAEMRPELDHAGVAVLTGLQHLEAPPLDFVLDPVAAAAVEIGAKLRGVGAFDVVEIATREGGVARPHQRFRRRCRRAGQDRAATILEGAARAAGAVGHGVIRDSGARCRNDTIEGLRGRLGWIPPAASWVPGRRFAPPRMRVEEVGPGSPSRAARDLVNI